MKDRDSIWKKRKEYLQDPDKPHGYLVAIAGWFPGDKLIID